MELQSDKILPCETRPKDCFTLWRVLHQVKKDKTDDICLYGSVYGSKDIEERSDFESIAKEGEKFRSRWADAVTRALENQRDSGKPRADIIKWLFEITAEEEQLIHRNIGDVMVNYKPVNFISDLSMRFTFEVDSPVFRKVKPNVVKRDPTVIDITSSIPSQTVSAAISFSSADCVILPPGRRLQVFVDSEPVFERPSIDSGGETKLKLYGNCVSVKTQGGSLMINGDVKDVSVNGTGDLYVSGNVSHVLPVERPDYH